MISLHQPSLHHLALHHLSPIYFLTSLPILPSIELVVFNPSSRIHQCLTDGHIFRHSSIPLTSITHIMLWSVGGWAREKG